jgi:hypothetical protein
MVRVSLPDSHVRVPAHDVEGDLGLRVARTHHEHASVLRLGRIPVVTGTQLDDARARRGGTGTISGTARRYAHRRGCDAVSRTATAVSALSANTPSTPRPKYSASSAG